MDKRKAVAIGLMFTAGVLLFWLLGTPSTYLIVQLGILSANFIALMAQILAVLLVAGAIGIAAVAGYRAIGTYRKRQAELAPKPEISLVSRKETDLDRIVPALESVAARYPNTDRAIQDCIDQVNRVRKVRAILKKFFDVNTGVVKDFHKRYGYGAHEKLMDDLLATLCPGLVRIIYRAQLNDPSDVIAEVIRLHAGKVKAAEELGEGVADSLTNLDADTADIVQRLDDAISNQENPNQEGKDVFSL